MHRFAERVFGFFLPLAAVLALTILLIFALARLAQIQQDMRSNVNANMLWVITQTQVKGLHLSAALRGHLYDGTHGADIFKYYQLLSSRLKLLSDGPQARYLDTLGNTQPLVDGVQTLQGLADSVPVAMQGDALVMADLLDALDALNTQLTATANKAMVAQWEEMGSRLDRYRNGVLTIIFLMLGIFVCGSIISVSMLIALRRVRESEWTKRQAVQLQSQLDAERHVSELYRNFAAMVSHQFRTPLAIIDASMQRLLRAEGQIDRHQLVSRVQKVRRATARLARLVEHTRLADQYAELMDVEPEACALWPLIHSIVTQQQEITPDRMIDLAPADADIPPAHCDPVLVEHIIFNFLSNAVKYSPADVPIQVRVFRDRAQVCCTVRDFGVGISETDLPYVFNRYFRGNTVADIQGTGIGLYVAHNLAKMQGGAVDAISEPDGGSIFKVCFPVSGAPVQEQQDENSAA